MASILDRFNSFTNAANLSPKDDTILEFIQKDPETFLASRVGFIIGQLLIIGGVLFAFLLIIAAITWMMASGNEEEVRKAKKMFFTSILGMFVLSFASAIAYSIVKLLSTF